MALSTCRDCNREVSTLARHCVHCGRPRPTGTRSCSVIAGIVTVIVALALTGAAVVMAKRACARLKDRSAASCRERLIRCDNPELTGIQKVKTTSPESLRVLIERHGARVLDWNESKGVMTVDFPLKVGK